MSIIIKINDAVSIQLNKNYGICDVLTDSDELRSEILGKVIGQDLRLEETQTRIKNILNPVSMYWHYQTI